MNDVDENLLDGSQLVPNVQSLEYLLTLVAVRDVKRNRYLGPRL